MRTRLTSGVALSILLSCTGDLSTAGTGTTSGSTSSGGIGGSPTAPPNAWPDGEVPFEASVTLVHEGKLIDMDQALHFTTGPAGIGAPVDLSFVLTNHGEALSFEGDWITGDGYSLIGEAPSTLASKASVELRVRFDQKPLTAAAQAQGTLSIPAAGLAASLSLLAEVPRPLRAVIYGRGGYTAISDDYGVSWTDTEVPTEVTTDFQRITWGNGRFLRTWSNGVAWEAPGRYAWSDDGLSWHPSTVSDSFWASGCDWGLGRFVCARDRWVSWSSDGSVVFHESGNYGPFWNAIVFAGDRFVAVGRYTGRAISTDGATWTNVQQGSVDERYEAVTYGGGMILAIGGLDRYAASVSSDGGMNWTNTTWNTASYNELTSGVWFGGRFVISGDDAQSCLFESPDGQQFSALPTPGTGHCPKLLGVVGPALIAVRDHDQQEPTILRSIDAMTWTTVHTSPLQEPVYDMAAEETP